MQRIRASVQFLNLQMSKKISTSTCTPSSKNVAEGYSDNLLLSPVSTSKNGDYLICIQVKPGAKFNCITDISSEAVSLQISAPPVDGEANIAIVKFFSELLKLKKTEIDFVRVTKSRQKTIVISSKNITITTILETLKSNKGEKF